MMTIYAFSKNDVMSPIRRFCAAVLVIAFATTQPLQAKAQSKGLSIVRDAETEELLRDYATPIFKAANINTRAAEIILVNDRLFNAFVANGQKIFINVGAIMDAETPNEIIGVIAHESGHIAGGHLARLHEQVSNAKILSVIGMLAGGAAIAGAATSGDRVGGSGLGAAGVLAGSQDLVQRNLMSYQRGEERAADQAAVRFLTKTGQSANGMLVTFKRFADSSMFRSGALDPYRISHPLPQDRIAQLEHLVQQSPYSKVKDAPELQARHDMVRAKLFGYVERPETILRRYPPSDMSAPARYARAVVSYRRGKLSDAMTNIDSLIRESPDNAYFHELKGQAYFESGKPKEAIEHLSRAAALQPEAVPIRTLLGQAQVATGDKKLINEAIRNLTFSTNKEPDSADAFLHLAMAYGRKGDIGMAELSTARSYLNSGDYKNALARATRAASILPPNSAAFRKAQDIISYRPPNASK